MTNAFQHARKEDESSVPVKVVLTRTPDGVFLCVSDPHPGSRPPSRLATTTKAVAAWC
ncbi:ATP-binding protein [Streptomyces avermitilis]|uniref:ATP-binding protein n=1 Tax=Streptomyces avermitilis TaxID=33903 RepID=UPI003F5407AE